MESAGEVDWREELVQQIKSLKDAYFSELMEFDQNLVVQTLTEEQSKSLPREKADRYNNILKIKSCIRSVVKFLQLEESLETYRGLLPEYQELIHLILSFHGKQKANAEMNTRQESKSCSGQSPPETINLTADITPFTGGISDQQELPADGSIGQMSPKVVTTPSAGVRSPCFSVKSPGALQSSPVNDAELCCITSPVDKNALLKSRSQSPIAKPGAVAAASSCGSAKSPLPSSVKKSGFVAAPSPCSLVKSASPSAIAKSGIIPGSSPSDSDSSLLLHSNATVNSCKQITLPKLLTPDRPCQTLTPAGQAEDQEHGGAETAVAKKPIDRLIAGVLSSSPEVLRSSVNLMKSAIREMDSVPSRIQSNKKMKYAYDVTSPSESSALGSADGSTAEFEFDASDSASSSYRCSKRQKTQNSKDPLLDEIEAVNSRLIDTVISITSDDKEDGTTQSNGRTLVKLSYTGVSLGPSLKSHFATLENLQDPVMPVTLLIPADYPKSSPVILDGEGDAQPRSKSSSISVVVDAAFRLAFGNLPEPRSLKETAGVWDSLRASRNHRVCLSAGWRDSELEPRRLGPLMRKG